MPPVVVAVHSPCLLSWSVLSSIVLFIEDESITKRYIIVFAIVLMWRTNIHGLINFYKSFSEYKIKYYNL